ncbi:MAG: cysteine desulfurase [Christensenellaceae bacterium]|jgi:cysteine desulfurase|nr:cysteine desulfurase [Christensenellaceae bacterium]
MIALDYASNTPADERVLDAFLRCEREFAGNPSASHPLGLAAGERLAGAQARIAEMLAVRSEELIFLSGASEANNLAIKGLARAGRHRGKHILSSPLEHDSASGALLALQEQGYEVEMLDILPSGEIDLDQLRDSLRDDTILLALSLVDSELGAIQPISRIIELLKAAPNCRLHLDATQAVGKIPVSFEGIDTMSLAPHKFHGLNGSGLLIKREGVELEPLIHGGKSQSIYRSGTPALALAVAMETALFLALEARQARFLHVAALRKALEEGLGGYKKLKINSPKGGSPYILNLSVEGVRGETFQRRFGDEGVCVSVKSACSTPGTPSRPVYAISHDRRNALNSWRISLCALNTTEDISGFLAIFKDLYEELSA